MLSARARGARESVDEGVVTTNSVVVVLDCVNVPCDVTPDVLEDVSFPGKPLDVIVVDVTGSGLRVRNTNSSQEDSV
ncbi:hypothetical protein MTO96_010203 [Rhipicephalus appendiculatus]